VPSLRYWWFDVVGCGVIATAVVVLCLVWVGVVDDTPLSTKGTTTLKLSTFPVAMGLCGYCFSGHAVFPNLYSAMANRNQFPAVLLTW
jgi:vesicular inhibitory amino acid transporter